MAKEFKYIPNPAKAMRITAVLALSVSLSGCFVLPPAVQFASLALDGISYMSTGKSVSDHAISAFASKDCALHRALKDVNGICSENAVSGIDIDVASGDADISSTRKQQMQEISEAWLTSDLESTKEM